MTPDVTTSHPKPTPYLDTLAAKLTMQVKGVERRIEGVISQDEQKIAQVRKNLKALTAQAMATKAEYEGLLARFGPALERLKNVNQQIVASFSGPASGRDIAERAGQLLRAFTEAIAGLGKIPARVDALTLQDVMADAQGQVRDEVSQHTGGPERTKEKVEELVRTLEAFERVRSV